MTTNRTKLERIERRAARLSLPIDTARPALLASVLAKAEQVLRGDVLEPASHQDTTPDIAAHRERLLAWVSTRQG